jgi:hypothetical protein
VRSGGGERSYDKGRADWGRGLGFAYKVIVAKLRHLSSISTGSNGTEFHI